ncbi:MAG TPA: carbon storage regulator, partial [Planctomycetaceae bacterium]|nr:carbon storage regulator [Planctomycetaceae bacterium]HRF01719.1 carbon storage regulator [Pirellulaceae bacterium]
MLVLTRKKNDSIVIDGRITIQVLQVKGGGIRLGITAPSDVSILRGELKPFGVDGDGKRIEELLVPEGER